MSFVIGDLVDSESSFSGIGKIMSLDEAVGVAKVAFFESPIRNNCRPVEVDLNYLHLATIFDEANVYYLDEETGVWRRARYGSQHPDGGHLITFNHDESAVVPFSELNVLNLSGGSYLNPLEFLQARCCDTPLFTEWRIPFVRSYIEQRAACRSISSILSSSVEIEPHQIAIVRRVLEDDTKKYLLADEVGLGKTIEACLILREHVLQEDENALVIVAVPSGLEKQWCAELTDRFYLGDLLGNRVFVCEHDKLSGALEIAEPTMIVIDEAHQIAPWAWSDAPKCRSSFDRIACACVQSNICLLLSGTPLTCNEDNFLAMLHLLSPDSNPLTEQGKLKFRTRLVEREHLGGMYQAMVPGNDNDTLTDIVENIAALFPDDTTLHSLINKTKPLIDWAAPDEGADRSKAISLLRTYIGENYRLHQRMLRNRRGDSTVGGLFPGLAGTTLLSWEVNEQTLSIDQFIDAYRDEFLDGNYQPTAVTSENLVRWIELYLTSPMLVAEYAREILDNANHSIQQPEIDLLDELTLSGESEQKAKDKRLADFLPRWLMEHEKGKAIVFCGDESIADRVSKVLHDLLGNTVERHQPDRNPDFRDDVTIRVLVCDIRGEDGLNLHGGEKFIIHYSLPLSFSRIEQRNGRVNRYSAAIYARPIPSAVLVPNRPGIFLHWVDILDEAVCIFNQSVASLQYVLQEKIDAMWKHMVTVGSISLEELKDELIGPNGLLETERRKVNAQEELNSMNEEVEQSLEFANNLEEADDRAETQTDKMLRWICKGLIFDKVKGEIPGSFRFRYNNGGSHRRRTLVDAMSFVKLCVTGIDKEESNWSTPVTALMSPDRLLVSHGQQVYPMRFGQPFVDTIFQLSRLDTRGICSVYLRAIESINLSEPKIFFRCYWIISCCSPGSSKREQLIADKQYTPKLIDHWLDEGGKTVDDEGIQALLIAPYSSKGGKTKNRFKYQDIQIRNETWATVKEHFPDPDWSRIAQKIEDSSLATIRDRELACSDSCISKLNFQLEAVSAVILIGNQS